MNPTINIIERLLIKGRKLHQLGLDEHALSVLNQLTHFRNLPPDMVQEAYRRLTAIHRCRRDYSQARRHLAVVIAHQPDHPTGHYQMAQLTDKDIHADPRKALAHFRRALRQDPKNPRLLSSFGLFALRNGKEKAALGAMRRAFRLASDCPRVLTRYIKVLTRLHRFGEARRILRDCRFRLARQEWFQRLSNDFRFLMLRRQQRFNQRRQAAQMIEETPRLLAFTAQPRQTIKTQADNVRSDRPSVLPAPHLAMRSQRPDQRHAQ